MLPGEEIACSTHIGGQLINFIKTPVGDTLANLLIPQISKNEVVVGRYCKFMFFPIDTSDPAISILEVTHQMTTNESSGSTNKNSFHKKSLMIA